MTTFPVTLTEEWRREWLVDHPDLETALGVVNGRAGADVHPVQVRVRVESKPYMRGRPDVMVTVGGLVHDGRYKRPQRLTYTGAEIGLYMPEKVAAFITEHMPQASEYVAAYRYPTTEANA